MVRYNDGTPIGTPNVIFSRLLASTCSPCSLKNKYSKKYVEMALPRMGSAGRGKRLNELN